MPDLTVQPHDRGDQDYLQHFQRFGYAVVKAVFSLKEVDELKIAFDRVYAQALEHPRSFRHGNTLFRLANDRQLGRIVRYVQWPSYFDHVLDRFRRDPRLFRIVAPLIGENIKQIINQMHWKPPGAAAEFGYHQDIRFRRPRTAYRDPANSYVQTGIAVDAHRADNGAMVILPGSHTLGELDFGARRVMDTSPSANDLDRAGLAQAPQVTLELEPGDVALWHLFLVHGSGANRTASDRRLYINGYVRAENCDRGEWTFRAGGEPVPLGAPVLVHYEDLYRRPEPHYLDD